MKYKKPTVGIRNPVARAMLQNRQSPSTVPPKKGKGAKVTNWENPVLSDSQARYAANDAFVGLLVFEKMFV